MGRNTKQHGEAREDHEGFEAFVTSCHPFPDALGFSPDSGVPGHGEGQNVGASGGPSGGSLGCRNEEGSQLSALGSRGLQRSRQPTADSRQPLRETRMGTGSARPSPFLSPEGSEEK